MGRVLRCRCREARSSGGGPSGGDPARGRRPATRRRALPRRGRSASGADAPTCLRRPVADCLVTDPFVHLHVASGYSLRHGASAPRVLAERAAEHGMTALALTDRDGVYGAVRFAKACQEVGIRPVLGVDLAVLPFDPASTPTPTP